MEGADMKHSSPVINSTFQLSVLSFWSWRQTWVALLEEGMMDEVAIDFVDADNMDVRKDENDEERRSVADDAVADAAVVSEVSAGTGTGTGTAADAAKFLSLSFDTRK
mmetsp:Transcript_15123/g.43732  ORF Transcript_15123/g.43732 Transcript_15123/m.43732 type:complete len:108 (-) Transcript_15123:458-781(-)